MKYLAHRIVLAVFVAVLVGGAAARLVDTAQAAIGSCSAVLTPHTVAPGSTTNFQLSITNEDTENDIQYILVLRPSGSFTILGGSGEGWNAVAASEQIVFEGSSISAPDTQTFTIQAQAENAEVPASNWSVFVSDSPDGSGSSSCTSDTATEVTNSQPFSLSGIAVGNITSSSATITWTTNRPSNSRVDYGPTASYGSVAASGSSDYDTSHSLTLSGLSPSTAYHYRVSSTTDTNETAQSGDNTFLTAAKPSTSTASPGTTGSNVPGVTIKPTPTETVPPTISLSSNLSKPFRRAPLMSGQAEDNEAVARIEYSTDGGKNWLPVDDVSRVAGAKRVNFSFTPELIDDGDYQVVLRATDSSGNTATTSAATLIIDRLPPQIGPLVMAYGPEVLTPNSQGVVDLVVGTDYRLSTSAVGGPTSIVIEAGLEGRAQSKTFTLTQSAESGLWNGLLGFTTGGTYELKARSIDGAGNITNRLIATVTVSPAGRVTDQGTKHALSGAIVTLHYQEPSSGQWQDWNAAPYGQANPQTTKSDGGYSLMVPEGKYYLEVRAPLHRGFVSDIFTVERPQALTAVIPLGGLAHIGPLQLPDIVWQSQRMEFARSKARPATTKALVGTDLPDFQLPTTAGGTKRALDLAGRPTVITTLSTWSPDSQSQLPALAAAQSNRDVNVVPLFSQERAQPVSIYLDTAGYSLTGLVDADGVLVPQLQVGPVPQHIFVDRSGRIKKVMVGVLSKEELLNQLGGL